MREGKADNSIYKDDNDELANPFKHVKSINKDQEDYPDLYNNKI